MSYDKFQLDLKIYGKLIAKYELVKLNLMMLLLVVDSEAIQFLNKEGFKINESGRLAYTESIVLGFNRSNIFLTKIQTKLNDINDRVKEKEKKSTVTIEASMASISAAIGFNIPMDVTLARFNEYRKIAKAKSEKGKKR